MRQEEWRSVPGVEGLYEVSDQGRVRRCRPGKGTKVGKVIKGYPAGYGYLAFRACLGSNDNKRPIYVHRAVLEAFVGPCPGGCEARHLDGDLLNNHLDNLQWGTRAENDADKVRHGTTLVGSRNPRAKLNEDQAREIYRLAHQGLRHIDIAMSFGVSRSLVGQIYNRQIWSHALPS